MSYFWRWNATCNCKDHNRTKQVQLNKYLFKEMKDVIQVYMQVTFYYQERSNIAKNTFRNIIDQIRGFVSTSTTLRKIQFQFFFFFLYILDHKIYACLRKSKKKKKRKGYRVTKKETLVLVKTSCTIKII